MAQTRAAQAHRIELHGAAALAAVAMLLGVAFGLSTLLTPLYPIYQQQFGFSQLTLTLIYAAYVIGNVAALLFLGHVSDRAGRRITALGGIAILIAAAFVFLFAAGVANLAVARILTGLGIGIASGTGNAWLAELVGEENKTRAAMIGTSSNFLGLGLAPLMSGLLAQDAPAPLQLSFIIYLAILVALAALVWCTEESVERPELGTIDLRPKLALPAEIRGQFVAPAITGFGLMALVGFYAALMPGILSQDLHISSHAAAGALFFELAAVTALVIVATQQLASRTAMISSLALMIPAAGAIAAAKLSASLGVMLAATAVVAVATGLGYRGSLQVVNEIAPEDQRAAVVSSFFVCCFTGNALPVIGVGVLSAFTGTTIADMAFAGMIAVFAVIAITFGLIYRR
jgi:hypothetical protein